MSWLPEHYSYACDTQRTARFREAITRTMKPSDHVLDLGCGAGFLGALCLEAGASRVTGIDETPACDAALDVYRRASKTAATATIRASSFEVELEDRADIIICDHVGYFGLDYGLLSLLQDARTRFLAPGGRIMPAAVSLYMAPVGSENCRELAFGWSAVCIPHAMHPLTDQATNTKHAVTFKPQDVLGTPVELGNIDLMKETESFFSFRAETVIAQAGEMHGLAGWFDTTLCDGVTMTNDPTCAQRIDRYQAFFPIGEPLNVTIGDRVSLTMAMRPDDHVFAWTVDHHASGKRFRHATLDSTQFGTDDLKKADQSRVPLPNNRARAGEVVMSYCDGQRSIAQIRDAVLRDHPDLLPSRQASEDFINDWLATWTR